MINISPSHLNDFLEIEIHPEHSKVGDINALTYAKDAMMYGISFTLRNANKQIVAIGGFIENMEGGHILWSIFSVYCKGSLRDIYREYKKHTALYVGEKLIVYTTHNKLAVFFGFIQDGEITYGNVKLTRHVRVV